MKSVGSHGSSSLLFMMKVLVRHFLSDSHKVRTAIGLVILPSECCCGVSLCNLIAVFNLKASLALMEANKPVAGS
jgi:hypothetical protein